MGLQLDERQRAMLLEMGVRVWLPGTAFAPAEASVPERPKVAVAAKTVPVVAPVVTSSVRNETAAQDAAPWPDLDWGALVAKAAQCQDCGLCEGRKKSTLSDVEPPAQSDWFVLGDAPDEWEDSAGQPFVDQPGVLLDNMLKAMGASRAGSGAQGAYVSNVVKCRPPHGRNPQLSELQQCAAYVQREIAMVQPKVILAMGRFAIQLLLADRPDVVALPLGKQRGAVYRYLGIPVVVTYHPRVLLRAAPDKGKAWADLCLAMDTRDASM